MERSPIRSKHHLWHIHPKLNPSLPPDNPRVSNSTKGPTMDSLRLSQNPQQMGWTVCLIWPSLSVCSEAPRCEEIHQERERRPSGAKPAVGGSSRSSEVLRPLGTRKAAGLVRVRCSSLRAANVGTDRMNLCGEVSDVSSHQCCITPE
jgi:hypothetical protein